jgi:hypothetical protein
MAQTIETLKAAVGVLWKQLAAHPAFDRRGQPAELVAQYDALSPRPGRAVPRTSDSSTTRARRTATPSWPASRR